MIKRIIKAGVAALFVSLCFSVSAFATTCSFTQGTPTTAYIMATGLEKVPHGQFYRATVIKPGHEITEFDLFAGEEVPLIFNSTVSGIYHGEVGIIKNFGGPGHLSFQKYTLLATCESSLL